MAVSRVGGGGGGVWGLGKAAGGVGKCVRRNARVQTGARRQGVVWRRQRLNAVNVGGGNSATPNVTMRSVMRGAGKAVARNNG